MLLAAPHDQKVLDERPPARIAQQRSEELHRGRERDAFLLRMDLTAFLNTAPPATKRLRRAPATKPQLRLRLLHGVRDAGVVPVHFLLYGPTGSAKTEFMRKKRKLQEFDGVRRSGFRQIPVRAVGFWRFRIEREGVSTSFESRPDKYANGMSVFELLARYHRQPRPRDHQWDSGWMPRGQNSSRNNTENLR